MKTSITTRSILVAFLVPLLAPQHVVAVAGIRGIVKNNQELVPEAETTAQYTRKLQTESISSESLVSDSISEESIDEESISEENISEESIGEESTSEESISEESSDEGPMGGGVAPATRSFFMNVLRFFDLFN